jgi:hypothetical protein
MIPGTDNADAPGWRSALSTALLVAMKDVGGRAKPGHDGGYIAGHDGAISPGMTVVISPGMAVVIPPPMMVVIPPVMTALYRLMHHSRVQPI